MSDVENPMIIGEPIPDPSHKKLGNCKQCSEEIWPDEGAGIYDGDEMFCGPYCLWRYLKSEKIIEEI